MTALAGFLAFDGRVDAADRCGRMLTAQRIYGPDGERQWESGDVAFGRRLFHLLPEDDFDRGPIVGAAGRYVLVGDARLDNRAELIEALGIDRAGARRTCDAAFLLAAWEKWQASALDRLVGDFAFALWDSVDRRLWLARDFLGQRPLFYHAGDGFFAFASMPKGLHALAEIPYAPDDERVAEFLALLPDRGSRTFFRGIERVEPGHIVSVTAHGREIRRYWNPERNTIKLADTAAYVEAMRHHLDQAVASRLRRSRGKVGTHLSAGLDSSAVTATAARLLQPAGEGIVAFTSVPRLGYDRPALDRRIGDEGPLAAETAALYPNIEHVLIRSDGRSPLADLDRYFFLHEAPILNACNGVWFTAINAAARERDISVILMAQMGNMSISFNGLQLLSELVRRGRWLAWFRAGRKLTRARTMRWRGVLVQSFGSWMPGAAWVALQRAFGRGGVNIGDYSAIRRERLADLDLPQRARERGLDFRYRPRPDGFETRLWALQRADVGTYYKGTLGGWGVDLRDPTADQRLVEFCLQVPTEEFLSDGMQRALALRALADRLPVNVLRERRRGLQAVDWHEGLTLARDDVAMELDRLAACPPVAATLDVDRLRHLLGELPSEGWERQETIQSYRILLLRGIAAGHFMRRAYGSNM